MQTEKLYEVDSHLSEFKANVIECTPCKDGFKTVLNKTAFFPEGGGQAADTGFIGDIRISDVQIENGVIYHFSKMAVEVGSEVNARIDYARRFAFMQNHTGEHIVSGIAHSLYGLQNVGFHLGQDVVTIDLNGELSREQLDKIEDIANRKVWENLKVSAFYPDAAQLSEIDYRSKREIDGAVRLVEIEGTDICACCAPHVSYTGEIGIIKLLDFERMRGGTRIYLKCGEFALNDYRVKYENIRDISNRLSAKQEESALAVEQLESKLNEQKMQNGAMKKRLCDVIVKSSKKSDNCLFLEGFDIKELQLVADGLHKTYGGIKAVFSGCDGNYSFAICGEDASLQKFFARFKSELNVRGGGRGGMYGGTVLAAADEIKLYF